MATAREPIVDRAGHHREAARVPTPLWGVGNTAPYGHDGRSINLLEVILRHGGEAEESRGAFEKFAAPDRDAVIAR